MLIFYLLLVNFRSLSGYFRSNSDGKTYQEQYHRQVKQSCQPTQTIFLVQKSHLVFLFYQDSNLYDPYECIRSQINGHSKKLKLNDCMGILWILLDDRHPRRRSLYDRCELFDRTKFESVFIFSWCFKVWLVQYLDRSPCDSDSTQDATQTDQSSWIKIQYFEQWYNSVITIGSEYINDVTSFLDSRIILELLAGPSGPQGRFIVNDNSEGLNGFLTKTVHLSRQLLLIFSSGFQISKQLERRFIKFF